MKRVCVYSGSNLGNKPEYKECAARLGKELAKRSIELVYGGSNNGLMGEVANQVLKNGGKAIGVLPTGLFPQAFVNTSLTELIEVKDMHERKKTMSNLADGFITLTGGVGTFEELFEILSWAQLGIHKKPIGIINTLGFYDPLINLLNTATDSGFMNESNKNLLIVDTDPSSLLDKMSAYTPPQLVFKWNNLKE